LLFTASYSQIRHIVTERILELATEHHLAGRATEAEGLYRELLTEEPGNADALHRLGVLAMQKGDNSEASHLIGQALGKRQFLLSASQILRSQAGEGFGHENRNNRAECLWILNITQVVCWGQLLIRWVWRNLQKARLEAFTALLIALRTRRLFGWRY
jgi:hypothetical protein